MLRVRGEATAINAIRPGHPFGYLATEQVVDDGTQLLIGFGADAARCDAGDVTELQRQLDAILPGYALLDATAHDWLADEFSQGTWAIHRPGWYGSTTLRCAGPRDASCSPARTSPTAGRDSSTARSSPG